MKKRPKHWSNVVAVVVAAVIGEGFGGVISI